MIRKRNRNCNSLARKFKSREEKCRRIEFWPRLQSRFSLGIASYLKDETKIENGLDDDDMYVCK